jgi:hypothetical protein
MRVIMQRLLCCCRNKKAKGCIWCVGVIMSLPAEHAAWEYTPGGMWFIKAIGLHI